MKSPAFLAFALTSSAAALSLASACGGADAQDVFASSSSGSVSGTEAGTQSSSGTSGSSGASGSSGSSGSSGASGSSGSSGSSGVDSGPPPNPGLGIFCGEKTNGTDNYCPTSGLCCGTGQAGNLTYACVAGAAQCVQGVQIKCDDKTDCTGGEVCCGVYVPQRGYRSTSCMPASACNGNTTVQLCDPSAKTDECTMPGYSCQDSSSLNDFFACKAN